MTFANRVESEIVGPHRFLEDWFTAAVPNSSESFARLAKSWSAPLLLISPTNEFLSATAVLQTTMAQYGAFPGLRIAIRDLQVTAECESAVAIAIYEEWHIEQGQGSDARLCSAAFVEDSSRPNAVRWVHVHESPLCGYGR